MSSGWPHSDPAVDQLEEEATQVIEPEPEPNGEVPASLLDQIASRREQLGADRFLDVPVPGQGNVMRLRLHPLPGSKVAAIVNRAQNSTSPESDFNGNADMVIAACREVVFNVDGDWTVLHDAEGNSVRIGEELAERLRLQAGPARNVLRQLFAAAPMPELAVGMVADRFARWASGQDVELNEELLGES